MVAPTLMFMAAIIIAQAAPIDVGVNSLGRFAFDWSGEYADGSPMASTTDVMFHYQPVPPLAGIADGGHRTVKVPLEAVVGENRVPLRDALEGIPEGVYDVKAVLIGVGGNWSAHSPALSIRVRGRNPAAPRNLRVVQ